VKLAHLRPAAASPAQGRIFDDGGMKWTFTGEVIEWRGPAPSRSSPRQDRSAGLISGRAGAGGCVSASAGWLSALSPRGFEPAWAGSAHAAQAESLAPGSC